MQQSSEKVAVEPTADDDTVTVAEVIGEPLFPYNFTKLNRHGLRLDPDSYCFYRTSMLIAFTALFTLLLLYGPELRYALPLIQELCLSHVLGIHW